MKKEIDNLISKSIKKSKQNLKRKSKSDTKHKNALKQLDNILIKMPEFFANLLERTNLWVFSRELNYNRVKKLVDGNIEKLNSGDLVSPKPHIIIPLLQEIAHAVDDDLIFQMYANLITHSVQKQSYDKIHPSHCKTLSQLSPVDASNLMLFRSSNNFPIVSFYIKVVEKDHTGMVNLKQNVFISNKKHRDANLQELSLAVLQKLGLIEINFNSRLPAFDYSVFEKTKLKKMANKAIALLNQKNQQLISQNKTKGTICLSVPNNNFSNIKVPVGAQQYTFVMKEGFVSLSPVGVDFVKYCIS